MFNAGNPNLKFSTGGPGFSNTAPFSKPTQQQIGSINPMMLMSMLQNQNKGDQTQVFGQDYTGSSAPLAPMQRDPKQIAYQQAVMSALMNRGGGF